MKALRLFILLTVLASALHVRAQQYTGLEGLIHVPSAEMDSAGTARIGGHFLNRHFTPKANFVFEGKRYDTGTFYLSITPFSWVQISYSMTMLRLRSIDSNKPYFSKDRYFSVKFQPLAEKDGKWWPSVAFGGNDVISSSFKVDQGSGYFMNFFLAATKTFDIRQHRIGVTMAYRYFTKKANSPRNGIVGGVTWRPAFAPGVRAILEYAGGGQVDFGIDCILWRHLMIQASLQRFRYPSAGLAYVIDLF